DAEEQRRQTEAALTANERRLKLAMDAGGIGTFEWDLSTGKVVWDGHLVSWGAVCHDWPRRGNDPNGSPETNSPGTDNLSRSPQTGVSMYARLSIAILVSAAYAAGACEKLSTLKLEKATITSAQEVEAGAFTPLGGRAGRGANAFQKLPTFCRVQATLT